MGKIPRASDANLFVDQRLQAEKEFGLPVIDEMALPGAGFIALGPNDLPIYKNRAGDIVEIEIIQNIILDGNGPLTDSEDIYNFDGNG